VCFLTDSLQIIPDTWFEARYSVSRKKNGVEGRNQTTDTRIFSRV